MIIAAPIAVITAKASSASALSGARKNTFPASRNARANPAATRLSRTIRVRFSGRQVRYSTRKQIVPAQSVASVEHTSLPHPNMPIAIDIAAQHAAAIPPGRARSRTFRRNLPLIRSSLGSSARTNPGNPIIRVEISVSWMGLNGYCPGISSISRLSRKLKIVLVRNMLAALVMLLITLRPSSTISGSTLKSEVSRVSWAAFFAASAPLAIAMEQSAVFRAGMSFTPSPVIATLWPFRFRAATSAFFCSGVTRPKTVHSSHAFSSSSSVCSVDISTYLSQAGIPARFAIMDTVSGLSPDMTRTSTS